MPLYTGGGDRGETGLFDNQRVPKDHVRIEAYGTIDELNAVLGVLRSNGLDAETDARTKRIQDLLFEIGADLATVGGKASLPRVEPGIQDAEHWIDESEAVLAPLRTFVLPGGSPEAAHWHLARTVSRRAERRFWTLARDPAAQVPVPLGIYLNRLSDLFFSWARRANHRRQIADVPWERG
jgi:cob(I)alamin adenosyltransferase